MERILLAGASGFIGKNLSQFLSQQYQLFSPSHKELDLLDTQKVNRYVITNHIDYIIHAAKVGGTRDTLPLKDTLYLNLKIFFNLVKNEPRVKKIIYFGSGAEYDKSRPLKKVKEEDFNKRIPSDEYGFHKYICAQYLNNLKSQKIICLRLFGIYGPYENYLIRFISNTIVKNLCHLPIVINQNVYFDYLYVEDLFPIVNYFLDHKSRYRFYNITPDRKVDLVTIAQTVNKISPFRSKIIIKHEGLNNEYSGSNYRLRREIRGLKFTPLLTGIQKLFLWYKSRLKILNQQKILQDPYFPYCHVTG